MFSLTGFSKINFILIENSRLNILHRRGLRRIEFRVDNLFLILPEFPAKNKKNASRIRQPQDIYSLILKYFQYLYFLKIQSSLYQISARLDETHKAHLLPDDERGRRWQLRQFYEGPAYRK